jgi:hypothetical protein
MVAALDAADICFLVFVFDEEMKMIRLKDR